MDSYTLYLVLMVVGLACKFLYVYLSWQSDLETNIWISRSLIEVPFFEQKLRCSSNEAYHFYDER